MHGFDERKFLSFQTVDQRDASSIIINALSSLHNNIFWQLSEEALKVKVREVQSEEKG